MDRKQILENIRMAERSLTLARQALKEEREDHLIRRLSLVAQYASLVSHYVSIEVPGTVEMRSVWGVASKVCETSFAAERQRESEDAEVARRLEAYAE
jgi:hypothetical protein